MNCKKRLVYFKYLFLKFALEIARNFMVTLLLKRVVNVSIVRLQALVQIASLFYPDDNHGLKPQFNESSTFQRIEVCTLYIVQSDL